MPNICFIFIGEAKVELGMSPASAIHIIFARKTDQNLPQKRCVHGCHKEESLLNYHGRTIPIAQTPDFLPKI